MDNQMRQYEIQEAKKRMGTYSGNAGAGMTNTTGAGMTSSAGGYGNMTSQAKQLKGSEKAQAQEDMSNHMY